MKCRVHLRKIQYCTVELDAGSWFAAERDAKEVAEARNLWEDTEIDTCEETEELEDDRDTDLEDREF